MAIADWLSSNIVVGALGGLEASTSTVHNTNYMHSMYTIPERATIIL